jgi:hypothetical protein
MHPAAVLSLGTTRDFSTCRRDIEAFLSMIPWQVARLEVKLWTSAGPPLVTRRWEVQGNLEEVVAEAARFITSYPFETGATLLAQGPDTTPRDRRPRFKPLLRKP